MRTFKGLYFAGLAAVKENNYTRGACIQHHGERVYSDNLKLSIKFIPGSIIKEEYTGKLLVVVESDRREISLSGQYNGTQPFKENDINHIKGVLCTAPNGERHQEDKFIFDEWNTDNASPSTSLSFVVNETPSESFEEGFRNYRNMKDVFNFTEDERAKSTKFHDKWNKHTEKHIALLTRAGL